MRMKKFVVTEKPPEDKKVKGLIAFDVKIVKTYSHPFKKIIKSSDLTSKKIRRLIRNGRKRDKFRNNL